MSQHYFGSTAFNWATGETREDVFKALARMAGTNIIKANVKANGGLYVWSCLVDRPMSARYEITCFQPVGVPLSEPQERALVDINGTVVPCRLTEQQERRLAAYPRLVASMRALVGENPHASDIAYARDLLKAIGA